MADRELEFDALVLAWRDGSLGDERFAELRARLLADPEARSAFVAALHRHRQTVRVVREPAASKPVPIYRKGCEPKPSRYRPRHYAFAVAAAVLVACGIAVPIAMLDPEPAPPEPAAVPVATLIDVSGGGRLIVDDDRANPGQDYEAGAYSIDTGTAELQLTSGTNVRLRGATRMLVHNDMRATLTHGTATFSCPPGAVGYTVALPDGARVVDLGTRFSVTVDDEGVSRVYVLEGLVRIDGVANAPVELATGNRGAIVEGRYVPWVDAIAGDDLSPIEATLSDTSPRYTFPVAADDLLQTSVASVVLGGPAVDEGVFGGQTIDALTNGPNVWHANPSATYESWSTEDGGSVTWRFDTDAAPWGYDLHTINVLAGCWPNRIGHLYTVEVQRLGDDAFVELHKVEHPDNLRNAGGAFERLLTVNRTGGEPLAADVVAVRITFHDDDPHGQNLGQSVFREIDIHGEPAGRPIPEPELSHPPSPDLGATR